MRVLDLIEKLSELSEELGDVEVTMSDSSSLRLYAGNYKIEKFYEENSGKDFINIFLDGCCEIE